MINPTASLYVESGGQVTPEGTPSESDSYNDDGYPWLINYDYETSVAMGFFVPTKHVYGLPGREFDFDLTTSEDYGPYRLFNRDLDPHVYGNKTELYGSIPYVMAHSTKFDAGFAWMNSADTWVEILPMTQDGQEGLYIDFLSEGGMMEFFFFASTKHPKNVQKNLATVTGFMSLPPINVLGFHFSKWAPVSADMVTERSQNFTAYGFPVDVFWMDIEHALFAEKETSQTRDYRWFEFNPYNFTTDMTQRLKNEVREAERRLVTIIDPHIQANEDYFVYRDGLDLQENFSSPDNVYGIFVQNEKNEILYAEAWPGNSTFIDFLNENAQHYW